MFENLLSAHVGELLRLRHGGEQLLDAHLPGRVAGLRLGRRGAGDRAARRKDDDGGQSRFSLGLGRHAGCSGHRKARRQSDDDQRSLQHDEVSYLVSMTMTGPHAVSRMLPIAYGTV